MVLDLRLRGPREKTFWILDFMLTPPLEAGTLLWGFQRGRASPLVNGGVKTPPAKWLRLLEERRSEKNNATVVHLIVTARGQLIAYL